MQGDEVAGRPQGVGGGGREEVGKSALSVSYRPSVGWVLYYQYHSPLFKGLLNRTQTRNCAKPFNLTTKSSMAVPILQRINLRFIKEK